MRALLAVLLPTYAAPHPSREEAGDGSRVAVIEFFMKEFQPTYYYEKPHKAQAVRFVNEWGKVEDRDPGFLRIIGALPDNWTLADLTPVEVIP